MLTELMCKDFNTSNTVGDSVATTATQSQYMVSVFCSTYNQRKYIRTCLDSLVNQKTSFKYEIIVKDDASTDGQQEIIKQYAKNYPDKIVLLLLEINHFSRGLGHIVAEKFMKMSRGKYIAVCEGDDFWTDENKLQTQVDFMEAHPECSLCGHAAYYANEDGTLRHDKYFRHIDESRYLSTEELIEKWMMATNSTMYRKSVKTDVVIPYQGKCVNGDYATLIYFSLKGKVYFLNKLMSAYRILSLGSLSRTARDNAKLAKERILELAKMLDRIDLYTNGQYSASVEKFKSKLLFSLYLSLNDREELRKYSHLWCKYGMKTAIKYVLCMYFNAVYSAILMLRHSWGGGVESSYNLDSFDPFASWLLSLQCDVINNILNVFLCICAYLDICSDIGEDVECGECREYGANGENEFLKLFLCTSLLQLAVLQTTISHIDSPYTLTMIPLTSNVRCKR